MKNLLFVVLSTITFSAFSINQRSISEMCLRSAEHISEARVGSHRDNIISPQLFNEYKRLNAMPVFNYSDYYLSNSPSSYEAYFYLLKNLKVVRSTLTNGEKFDFTSNENVKYTLNEIRILLTKNKFEPTSLKSFAESSGRKSKRFNDFLSLACYSATITPKHCAKATKYLITSSLPQSTVFGTTLYVKIINKFLSDEDYNLAINVAGLHILTLIEKYITFEQLPSKDIYLEIKEALMKNLKISEIKASELTLSILGFFSIRGASWFSSFRGDFLREIEKHFSSLLLITTAIQFFDKITFKLERRQFSIPNQINTSCYYAKPYHFWMAAYMAHDAISNGKFDKKSAVLASHLLGVGYELARIDPTIASIGYNTNNLPLEKNNQFSPAANAARIDLVFNTIGAWFGAMHMAPNKVTNSVNTTPALKKILNDSSTWASQLNARNKKISFYFYYAPHAHLSYVLSRL